MPGAPFKDDQVEEMLSRMGEGETLTSIAGDPRMPSVATMIRWEDEQDERGKSITQARARGYTVRAEKAVQRAQTTEDAVKGRLDFDAERWFLGKMHPKKFGDKIDVTSGGDKIERMDETSMAVRAAALVRQALERDAEPE